MTRRLWQTRAARPFIPQTLCGLLLFALALAARGQSASDSVDRANLFQPPPTFGDPKYDPITGTDNEHAAASPNDPDLGEQAILKRQEHYRPFTATAALPIFYTSNVALAKSGAEGDVVYAPVLGVTYAPHFTRSLYGTFSVAQQQFWYDRFREFDFGSFDFRAGLIYALPQLHDLSLRAEYNYNRLTRSDDIEDEFFSNHGLFLNAELPFRIGRAQQISIGADTSFSLAANPDSPGRHEFDGYVAYAVNLTRALTVNAVARLAVRDYADGDRTDVSEILALGATYRFTKWLSISGTSTLASNQSNQSVFDYDVGNVGGALAISLRF